MAGPQFKAFANGAGSASAATLSPAKPTVEANTKGALIAFCASKNNAVHSTATPGWTLINQTNSGASFTVSLWKAAQGAAAPVFTWTGAAAALAECYYYTDPTNSIDIALITLLGAPGTGTTTAHSSPGGNTTRNNVGAFYLDVCAANTVMSTPAGWTEDNDTGNANAVMRRVYGEKQIAVSGTPSGAIAATGGNGAWVQFQFQIAGSDPVGGVEASKEEAFAVLEPPSGAAFSKMTAAVWLDANEARFSKMEALAWLDVPIVPPSSGSGRRMSLM